MPKRVAHYITHPQVVQDPSTPVPEWHLSKIGLDRLRSLAQPIALSNTTVIVASAETKALETAAVFADWLGLEPVVRELMHENDRSASGYMPPSEFETTADRFYAEPTSSVRGWETALAAQARIVSEYQAALRLCTDGDLLIAGHGAVGTLLPTFRIVSVR